MKIPKLWGGELKHVKFSDEKIGERTKYWTYNISDLLESYFQRLLESVSEEIVYGYQSKVFRNENKGVFIIIGADHGAGKSMYLVQTNILDSK